MQESPRFLPDPFVMNGIYATPPAIDVGAWREYLSRALQRDRKSVV